MSARCVGQPISWLLLERHALGELAPEEARRVAHHLDACAACRASADRIESEASRALPELRLPSSSAAPTSSSSSASTAPASTSSAPRAAATSNVVTPMRRPARGRLLGAASALALAALAVLGVRFVHSGGGEPTAPEPSASSAPDFCEPEGVACGPTVATKGGDVTLSLARAGDEPWSPEAGIFHPGDRFKALVTCPPSLAASWDLVVLDGDGASFPLEPAAHLTCGNEVALPGAFRLTGATDAEVCVVWGERPIDRAALASRAAVLAAPHACRRLTPAASSQP